MSVDAGHKFFCHHEFAAPLIGANFISRAIRNVVTIKKDHGKLRQGKEGLKGNAHGLGLDGIVESRHGFRYFPFRKNKGRSTRFKSDNGLDLIRAEGGAPANGAAHGMGHEDGRAHLFKECGHGIGTHIVIKFAFVRRPRALELVIRLSVASHGRIFVGDGRIPVKNAAATKHVHRLIGIQRIFCIRIAPVIRF